jgi:uncharacterized membrane protein YhaH (DUF805 family)
MNYYLLALKGYAIFRGRSRRAEYWYFVLVHIIIMLITTALDFAFDLTIKGEDGEPIGIITMIYGILTLFPQLAVSIRRLHDTGRSGWWILIAFTIIGIIPLIFWYATDSEAGNNKFGANPKQIIV